MPDYINPPLETDPDLIAQATFDYITARFPEWEPRDSQLAGIIISALAFRAAESRDVASAVPRAIFRYFGNSIINLPPNEPQRAKASTTWTFRDTAAYSVPAGTAVMVIDLDGDAYQFLLENELVKPAGSATANGVTIIADRAGADASGLTGTAELNESNDDVLSVTLVGSTAGGDDGETDDEYLDRLSRRLGLMSPRPITASDFAIVAMDEGAWRAIVIDNYDPGPPVVTNAERAVAYTLIGETGEEEGLELRERVQARFDETRLLNFLASYIAPTYTAIDVTVTIKAQDVFLESDVDADVTAALQEYLNPARWGTPAYGSRRGWEHQPYVEEYELATVINQVPSVDRITALVFGPAGTALDRAPVNLPGPIPLTRPGLITVNIA